MPIQKLNADQTVTRYDVTFEIGHEEGEVSTSAEQDDNGDWIRAEDALTIGLALPRYTIYYYAQWASDNDGPYVESYDREVDLDDQGEWTKYEDYERETQP